MGISGITLSGFLNEELKTTIDKRFDHNQRVLEEAKQALLMYTYKYPELNIGSCDGEVPDGENTEAGCLAAATPGTWLLYTNLTLSKGPGRLPCPDHDNDGKVDPDEGGAACGLVGRFPWDENGLGFYDARDADGQRLWYAVSEEFRNISPVDPVVGGDVIVNSESGSNKFNITIVGQGGGIQYRGDVNGIAAVIIAPGPPINRDNDGDGVYDTAQNRAADENDPENYLDTFRYV
jgi:hypothetical protein